MNSRLFNWMVSVAMLVLLAFAPFSLTGCDRDQEILEVETPNGELEVERDPSTGEVEVETDE
ncbi:MAG: hypothetical protein KDA52_00720 [Planctomycetaceae bacterium]|nr:hypothetical protein [Planctomycetaceae bacterium]